MNNMFKMMTAASLLVLGQAAIADCTTNTVKGVWGFDYDAIDLQGQRTCVGVGFMTFNSGALSNNTLKITSQRNSCNGDPATTFAASGTYSIATSCAGKASVKYSATSPISKLEFDIVQAGTRMQFILVQGNGVTLHGEAFKR